MSDSGKRSKWDMPAQQQQESMTPSPIKDNERLKQLQTAVRRIHEKIQQPQLQSQQVSSSTGLVTQTFKPIVPETSSPSNLPYTIGSDNTFIKEIEINNVRNRYTLTKGATLSEVCNYACYLLNRLYIYIFIYIHLISNRLRVKQVLPLL